VREKNLAKIFGVRASEPALLRSWKPRRLSIAPWAEERTSVGMNLQPVCEAAEQTERGTESRRSWSIQELRERLGVAAPVADEGGRRKTDTDEQQMARPRIILRGMEQAAA
jgi:hypothetical protein